MSPMPRILAALALAAAFGLTAAQAQDGAEGDQWRHGTSLIGEVKYPEGFARFDYVNPDAPKGGTVRLSETGSFDSLNFVPPRGEVAAGIGNIYDTLMTASMDEISAEYGLLAEAMKYPADYSSVTFKLRDNARWHDGQKVTADDVVFSFTVLKEHNPQQAFYYQHVVKAEKTADNEVTFTFDEKGNRELPHIVGQLLILPKHYWEGTDASGKKRDIAASTLEPPLGSGAYKVKSVNAGRSISYERVPDYWGKDLPVNIGSNNFDELRYEYFRDETVELEALKADLLDWRVETTARVWATGYDFPAVKDGRVRREEFENPYRGSGVMVGFIFNLNRQKFQDPRVRLAFNYAFPYEEINKTIFYGAYTRLRSYFDGLDFASKGLPEGAEKALLDPLANQIPPEVFTEEFKNPVNATANDQRANLRKALALFKEAGWTLKGNKLVNDKGEPMRVEFLMNGPLYEKIALRYQTELGKIGIEFSIRPVDSSQYEQRVTTRDFDLIYSGWAQSASPGNEQYEFFGSSSAGRDGSRNYGAIKNPAVDALIAKIVQAPDRAALETAVAALDRVLLWNNYLVPGWTLRAARVAHWDRFGHPETLPEYSIGFPSIWWFDEARAEHTESTP
jgi:microcin C transport system substrate-binding protein